MKDQYKLSKNWEEKKAEREKIDKGLCVICKKPVGSDGQCHHISYERLGHEDVLHDLITLCPECHQRFHRIWGTATHTWETDDPDHWSTFSIQDTYAFIERYKDRDYFLAADGDINLCSKDVISSLLDDFMRDNRKTSPLNISIDDIVVAIRNLRYENYFFYRDVIGGSFEDFLDDSYGKKPTRGSGAKNEKRARAKQFFSKHSEQRMRELMACHDTEDITYMKQLMGLFK